MIWLALWFPASLLAGTIIGRAIRNADLREQAIDQDPEWLGIGGAVSFHVDGD